MLKSISVPPKLVMLAKTIKCEASTICDCPQAAGFNFALNSGFSTIKTLYGCKPKEEADKRIASFRVSKSCLDIFFVASN
jgi:hypothetical protein